MIVAERSYPTSADDVWDALTSPERLPRWFMPISGDLELGGRYQLEGNAGGTIDTCDPPKHLGVTWEFGGSVGWVDVYVAGAGDDTTLRLEHVGLVDDFDDKWDEFGPGAVGVGWDLSLLGLGEHLATGADLIRTPSTPDGWTPCAAAATHGRRRRSPTARRASRPGSRHPHCRVLHRRLMHAFDVLGDPVRRRILELLVDDELTSGAITADRAGRVRDLPARRVAAPSRPQGRRLRPRARRRRPPSLHARCRAAARRRRLAGTVPPGLGTAPRRPRHRDRPREASPPPSLTISSVDPIVLERVLDDTHSDEVRRVVPMLTFARFAANSVYRYAPPFIATIARGLDVDIADIGVALAIAEASGLASPLVGRLVDRVPRRVAMTGGMLGMAAGAAIAAGSTGVVWFAVGLLVLALTKIVFDIGLIAWTADHVPYERRGRVVGIIETSWAFGLLIGVSSLGVVTALTSWRGRTSPGPSACSWPACCSSFVSGPTRHDSTSPCRRPPATSHEAGGWRSSGCSG